jgi:hypothetical protein
MIGDVFEIETRHLCPGMRVKNLGDGAGGAHLSIVAGQNPEANAQACGTFVVRVGTSEPGRRIGEIRGQSASPIHY